MNFRKTLRPDSLGSIVFLNRIPEGKGRRVLDHSSLLSAFTSSLRSELSDTQISVSTIAVGDFKTMDPVMNEFDHASLRRSPMYVCLFGY